MKWLKGIRNQRGFSLVEMMTVLMIIAVLSAIVLASTQVGNRRQQLRDAAAGYVTAARNAESLASSSQVVNGSARKAYGVCITSSAALGATESPRRLSWLPPFVGRALAAPPASPPPPPAGSPTPPPGASPTPPPATPPPAATPTPAPPANPPSCIPPASAEEADTFQIYARTIAETQGSVRASLTDPPANPDIISTFKLPSNFVFVDANVYIDFVPPAPTLYANGAQEEVKITIKSANAGSCGSGNQDCRSITIRPRAGAIYVE